MEAPFLQGVPYFSREEEKTAREIAAARQNKDSVPDISIQEGDTTSFELIRRVRREVAAWKNRGTVGRFPLTQLLHVLTSYLARTILSEYCANRAWLAELQWKRSERVPEAPHSPIHPRRAP